MKLDIDSLPRVTICTDGTRGMVALDSSPDGFEDIAKGGSRPLALVEGGTPPSEYLMFVAGVNETVKGPLLFDDEAAAAVLAFYESRGRKRIAGDWEHDSMNPPEQRPPNYQGSPASHWFVPAVRPGPELWATEVKWTPTAFEQLSRGEYAHTSPVVKFEKKTGRILAVLSSALTNDPATIGQPQLVAASAESTTPAKGTEKPMEPTASTGTYKMADEPAGKIKGIVDGMHKDENEMTGKMKACLSEAFPSVFGEKKEAMADKTTDPAAAAKMSDDMEAMKTKLADAEKDMPAEERKEMKALRAAVVELTGKKTRIEQVAALTAFKDASTEIATLTATAAKNTSAAIDGVVAAGKKAMKLTPADTAPGSKTKAGAYIASQRSKGEEGVLALTAYVDALTPRVTTVDSTISEAKTNEIDTVTLSATEVESLRKNGGDAAAYLKNKRERIAAGDAPRF